MRGRALAGVRHPWFAVHQMARFADHATRTNASRTPRHRDIAGHTGSNLYRHRRGAVGQHPGTWDAARARALPGASGTTGTQAGHIHQSASCRTEACARADLAPLRSSQGVSADPTARRRGELRARFDRIFRRCTGIVVLGRLLMRLRANKPTLLGSPEIPLNIRLHVIKRKISGGTRSLDSRGCRNAFLGLMRTAAKLGIAFWGYLGDRLRIPG